MQAPCSGKEAVQSRSSDVRAPRVAHISWHLEGLGIHLSLEGRSGHPEDIDAHGGVHAHMAEVDRSHSRLLMIFGSQIGPPQLRSCLAFLLQMDLALHPGKHASSEGTARALKSWASVLGSDSGALAHRNWSCCLMTWNGVDGTVFPMVGCGWH